MKILQFIETVCTNYTFKWRFELKNVKEVKVTLSGAVVRVPEYQTAP